MAINSLDAIVQGRKPAYSVLKVGSTMEAAGVLHSLFYSPSGAAVAPTPGLAGAALTTYSGQIPFSNPVSGNTHLDILSCSATQLGTLYLLDRLWHNSGIAVTTTTAQTVNSVTFPARDRDGTTNGSDVLVGIEVSTATTNGAAVTNTTLSYTNQAGTASRTATITSFPATSVAGTFVPFELAAGDTGVRSVQSITLGTSYGAGAIHLVAYRILQKISIFQGNGNSLDPIQGGLARLYDNTVPFLVWRPVSTTAVTLDVGVSVTQG